MFKLPFESPKTLSLLVLVIFSGAGMGAALNYLFSAPNIVPNRLSIDASLNRAPSGPSQAVAMPTVPQSSAPVTGPQEILPAAPAQKPVQDPPTVTGMAYTHPIEQRTYIPPGNPTQESVITSSPVVSAALSHPSTRSATRETSSSGAGSMPTTPGVRGGRNPISFDSNTPMQMSPSAAKAIQGASTPVLPAVMADLPSDVQIDPTHAAIQDQMADQFVSAVGGENPDPTNPAYKARWQNAQWQADQRYRALYGAQAFAEMQKRAYLQSTSAPGQQ
jgi:hypothetical protein